MKINKYSIFIISTLVACVSVGGVIGLSAAGVFSLTPERLTAEFKDYDGSLLWSTKFSYGETIVYGGAIPERDDDETHSYSFSNWDKSLQNVTQSTTFYAQYIEEDRDYKCTFYNYNNVELYSVYVPYNGEAYFIGSAPTRPTDETGSYKFIGWDKPLSNITQDTAFVAQYERIPFKYKITFVNYDSTVLDIDEVEYGENAHYKGLTPVRPSTPTIEYTFKGWDKELTRITSSFTTKAMFEENVAKYKVEFYNYDSTLLYTDYVGEGGTAEYVGPTPVHALDGTYTYVFSGWNKSLANIHRDTSVTAEYTKTLKQYEVIFKNYDGTVLQVSAAYYGAAISYNGEIPTKPDDDAYSYTFDGWDRDISFITGSGDIYPVWKKTLKQIECTFVDYNGVILSVQYVEYGRTITYMGETPYKPSSGGVSYRFVGWDEELTNIIKPTKFTALFEAYYGEDGSGGGGVDYSTIFFRNWDGTLLDTDICEIGQPAEFNGIDDPPKRPSEGGRSFIFTSWDKQEYLSSVPINCFDTYAQYKTSYGEYIVSYRTPSGQLIHEEYVTSGGSCSYVNNDLDILSPEFGFIGWGTYFPNDYGTLNPLTHITKSITVFPIYANSLGD